MLKALEVVATLKESAAEVLEQVAILGEWLGTGFWARS